MILEYIAKKNKLSKSDIAKDLDISESMVTLLFQRKRNPSIKLIKRIKNTYNISLNKIMEDL
jgi:transcriptional regulator with XRE-family HTH domain